LKAGIHKIFTETDVVGDVSAPAMGNKKIIIKNIIIIIIYEYHQQIIMSSGAAAKAACPLPPIPSWAKIANYRTMTNEKKDLAVAGNKNMQYEWMVEEVNEFYEAIHLNDPEEIRDEAMGLIRTVQQFAGSKRVVTLWGKVRKDVSVVFPSRAVFNATFKKWHAKKLAKKQALDVVVDDLVRVSGIRW
jgi:hypothetical protein